MNLKQRRVLELLAASGPRGRADSVFLAKFTVELLDLVRNGLVTAWPASVKAKGQRSDIARISITDEGRRMLERAE
jgi:hypothetical protein